MKKQSFLSGAACLLVLSACSSASVSTETTVGSSSSSVTVSSSSSSTQDNGASVKVDTTVKVDQSKAQVITITAQDWAFSPNIIRVKKGSKVTLKITSLDKVHGFSVQALGINEQLPPNQTVTVELPTDRAGTFDFRCSVPCGPGHREMTGQIIIEE